VGGSGSVSDQRPAASVGGWRERERPATRSSSSRKTPTNSLTPSLTRAATRDPPSAGRPCGRPAITRQTLAISHREPREHGVRKGKGSDRTGAQPDRFCVLCVKQLTLIHGPPGAVVDQPDCAVSDNLSDGHEPADLQGCLGLQGERFEVEAAEGHGLRIEHLRNQSCDRPPTPRPGGFFPAVQRR
jgi:hypothetical protein